MLHCTVNFLTCNACGKALSNSFPVIINRNFLWIATARHKLCFMTTTLVPISLVWGRLSEPHWIDRTLTKFLLNNLDRMKIAFYSFSLFSVWYMSDLHCKMEQSLQLFMELSNSFQSLSYQTIQSDTKSRELLTTQACKQSFGDGETQTKLREVYVSSTIFGPRT